MAFQPDPAQVDDFAAFDHSGAAWDGSGTARPSAARYGPFKAHWATGPGLGGCTPGPGAPVGCDKKEYPDVPLLFNVEVSGATHPSGVTPPHRLFRRLRMVMYPPHPHTSWAQVDPSEAYALADNNTMPSDPKLQQVSAPPTDTLHSRWPRAPPPPLHTTHPPPISLATANPTPRDDSALAQVIHAFQSAYAAEVQRLVPYHAPPAPDGPGEGAGTYGVCCDRAKGCDCDGKPSE